MTDDTNPEEGAAVTEVPEMQTFTVQTMKTIDVDFTDEQLEQIRQRTGEVEAEAAVEELFLDQLRASTKPEEKLKGITVDATGPSND